MTDMFKGDDAGLKTAAQALIDAVEQDATGRWFIGGEDPEALASNLLSALNATDDASLVKGRVLDSEGLTDKLTVGHPNAYLNAIFDFGAGLLAQWIAKGLPAVEVVDGIKHLESASRGLHALAARGAGQGEAASRVRALSKEGDKP